MGEEKRVISIRGASEGQLQSVDLDLSLESLICFVGRSGSGNRTMAVEVLYAESRRRYMLALSPVEREGLGGRIPADRRSFGAVPAPFWRNRLSTLRGHLSSLHAGGGCGTGACRTGRRALLAVGAPGTRRQKSGSRSAARTAPSRFFADPPGRRNPAPGPGRFTPGDSGGRTGDRGGRRSPAPRRGKPDAADRRIAQRSEYRPGTECAGRSGKRTAVDRQSAVDLRPLRAHVRGFGIGRPVGGRPRGASAGRTGLPEGIRPGRYAGAKHPADDPVSGRFFRGRGDTRPSPAPP